MMRPFVYQGLFFFYYFSIGTIPTYIYIFFQHRGFTPGEIGTLATLHPVAVIIGQFFWGIIADARVKRSVLIRTNLLVTSILILLFLRIDSYIGYCALLASFMFFYTPLFSLTDATVLESGGDHGDGYGNKRWWGSLSFCLAALGVGRATDVFGLSVIFPICAGSLFAAFLISLTPLEAHGSRYKPSTVGKWVEDLRTIIGRRSVIVLSIGVFFSFLTFCGNLVVFGLFWDDLGASRVLYGLSWLIGAVVEIPIYLCFDRLKERFGLSGLMMIASVAAIFRWGLYIAFPTPLGLLAGQAFHGINFVLLSLSAMIYMKRVLPVTMQNTAQAYFVALSFGGAALTGNWLGGHMYGMGGHILWYGFCIVVNLAALMVFFILGRGERG